MLSMGPMLLFILPYLLPAQPAAKPVPAQQMVQYLPSQCQAVATVDLSTMLPHVLKQVKRLQKHPAMKKSFYMRMMLNNALGVIKGQRARFKSALGIDPVKAVKYVSLCAYRRSSKRYASNQLLVVVGGTFDSGKMATQLANMISLPSSALRKIGSFSYWRGGYRGPSVGWFPKGPLFFGKDKVLRQFIKNKMLTVGKPAEGSAAANLVKYHNKNAIISLSVKMNSVYKKILMRGAPGPLRTLAKDMKALQLGFLYRGLTMEWANDDADVRKRYVKILRGFGLLGVAGDLASKALLDFVDALLDPKAKGIPPRARQLLAYKDEFIKAMRKSVGGKRATFQVSEGKGSVKLKLKGNPILGLLTTGVLGGVGFFFSPRRVRTMPSAVTGRKSAPSRAP